MAVSYKKLWKLPIDRDMKKLDLQAAAGICWVCVTKMSKEYCAHGSAFQACNALHCNIGDVMDVIPGDVPAKPV